MAILIEQIPSQNSLARGRCPRGRFGSTAINTAAFLNSSLIGALINKQSSVVGGHLRLLAPGLSSVMRFQEFSCSLAGLCGPEPCRNVVSLRGQPHSSSSTRGRWAHTSLAAGLGYGTKSGGTSPILSVPGVGCNHYARSSLRHLH